VLLIQEGKLTFLLYHGTSSLFIESIQTFGLGAKNPIKELGVVAFLERLYTLCEQLFPEDNEWIQRRIVVQPMIRQEVTSGGWNFRHGSSYLTPSRSSAVGYSLSNPFGSEIISQAYWLYKKISSTASSELCGIPVPESSILDLFLSKPEPYLVTVSNVPLESLESENGGPAEEVFEKIAPFFPFLNERGFTLNLNFRLIKPVSPEFLIIEKLDPEREDNPYR
jgi:hypothetical protein